MTNAFKWLCPNCDARNDMESARCWRCNADDEGTLGPDIAYERGYEAWNRDKPLSACDLSHDDAAQWREGWSDAQADNSQFGVGA